MVKSLKRVAISLLTVSVTSWMYALWLVPWIEGESKQDPVAKAASLPEPAPGHAQDFSIWFEPSDWEYRAEKVLRVEQGQALFQDWQTLPDDTCLVHPFTLIIQPQQGDSQDEAAKQAPLILQAEEGAKLTFDEPFLGGLQAPGKLEGAILLGKVVIFRPEVGPESEPLRIETQNVQIQDQRISTDHQVNFVIGGHHGSGQKLLIQLLADSMGGSSRVPEIQGIRQMELVKVNYLSLVVPEEKQPTEVNQDAVETRINVRCAGSFLLDMLESTASFTHDVRVVHHETGKQDVLESLDCQQLTIEFESPQNRTATDSVPVGKRDDFQVQRLIAVGQPAVLTAPTRDFRAQAEYLSYNPVTRQVSMRDSERVLLIHKDLRYEAPTLDYDLGQADPAQNVEGFGTAISQGPGRLIRLPGTDHSGLEITWEEELQLRPHDGLHALSLYGNPRLNLGSEGQFRASELHVWLQESNESSAKQGVQPVKMLAQGEVAIESPSLSGATRKLEVFWEDPPPGAHAANPNPAMQATEPQPRQSIWDGNAPGDRERRTDQPSQHLRLTGDFIRARLHRNAETLSIQEVTVEGRAHLVEEPRVQPGETPPNPDELMEITGRLLQVQAVADDRFSAYVVTDQDANVVPALAARGLKLFGAALQLDQSSHRVWMDGTGKAHLQPPTQPGEPQRLEGPVEITWTGDLNFDGQLVRIRENVVIGMRLRQPDGQLSTIEMQGDQLDIRLTGQVSLDGVGPSASQDQLDVETMILSGTVHVTHWQLDPQERWQAVDRLLVAGAGLDYQTGHLIAGGPGWLQTIRPQKKGSESLVHSRVEFNRSIEGNIFDKQFAFIEQVQVFIDDVQGWDDWPTRQRLTQSATTTYLRCDELRGAMVLTTRDAPETWVGEALGNAYVRGRGFEATASRMVYDQGKDLLTLEALDREDAQLSWQRQTAGQRDFARARTIRYWRTLERVEVDGVSTISSSADALIPSRDSNREPKTSTPGSGLGGYRR